MTYSCPTWECAADAHLLKLHRLQNRVRDGCTPVRELHLAFKIPYMYDYMPKLCRLRTEVIPTHENPNVHGTGQGDSRHKKYKRLKLGDSQAYDRSAD
jgi:hypothetical protein